MLDPYENITVGNFLYSIGLVLGSHLRGKSLPACINLLQQTPLDGVLGDVYLAYPGLVRLIEFKREVNPSSKEETKLASLRGALMKLPDLEKVSRAIHWYVETSEAPLEWTSEVVPYLDQDKSNPAAATMQSFVEALVERALAAGEPEFDAAAIKAYLNCVAKYAGVKGSTSSGLIVMLASDGTLRYVAVDNIREMRLELRLQRIAAADKALSIQAERQLHIARKLEQEQELNRSRSRSLGRSR